jgi:hypothetical protein
MPRKSSQKTFHLNTLVNGHLIVGRVRFSPAPKPGIFTELARFEAERMLAQALRVEIKAGRL